MTTITITGNATSDAELKYTASGKAVCEVSVAVNHRKKQGTEWVDDGATFYRCSAWEYQAEQMAESITRGQRLIVVGRLRNREYEHNGEKRRSLEVSINEIGPALSKWPPRDGARPAPQTAPAADPWGGAGNGPDEPPF